MGINIIRYGSAVVSEPLRNYFQRNVVHDHNSCCGKSKTIREKIVSLLSGRNGMGMTEIAATLQISRAATSINLKKLRESGEVVECSQGRNKLWKCSNNE